jgi:hypothetical protein
MTLTSCCVLVEIINVAMKSLRGARPPRLSEFMLAMAGRPKATRQSLPNGPETLIFGRKRLPRGVYPECLEGPAMTAFHPLLAP